MRRLVPWAVLLPLLGFFPVAKAQEIAPAKGCGDHPRTGGSGRNQQEPVKAPACETYKISGPTVIAFFQYEGCEKQPHCEDALDSFQYYLVGLLARLDKSAVRFHECYQGSFEVEVGGRRTTFTHEGVGYYLIVPGKPPHIERGVQLESDLVRLMTEYFGPDVVGKALAVEKDGLPVEWRSTLREFEAHDAEARRFVAGHAEGASDPRSRALAATLLSEWDLSQNADGLKRPMVVYAPKPLADSRPGRRVGVFTIYVDVGREGRVSGMRWCPPRDQKDLATEASQAVWAWLFRPAFKNGHFVIANVALEYILYAR